ncbi:hypothetical protein OHB07_38000 [Streptomyces sp. NBC_00111]|nr:hypothetical protein [Streptomyces sp. NBC_01460]
MADETGDGVLAAVGQSVLDLDVDVNPLGEAESGPELGRAEFCQALFQ